ncbi:MAG: hypothetical protein WBP58_05315 [Chitinophagaceae bacterium]
MITLPPCSTSKVSMFPSSFELLNMQLSEGDEVRKNLFLAVASILSGLRIYLYSYGNIV